MRNREVATNNMVPTPITQGGHVSDTPIPDGALISDDDDDSFISSDTESEGGFGDANGRLDYIKLVYHYATTRA